MKGFIGKKINYIQLTDFLDRIETQSTYSTIHTVYLVLIDTIGDEGKAVWNGIEFTKDSLLETMREEEGRLKGLELNSHPDRLAEVTIKFESGNEIVTFINEMEQYFQIISYLNDY